MVKPEIKFQAGKLEIAVKGLALDADKDGLESVAAEVKVVVDAAEVIGEILKKDISWLNAIIAQIKV